MMNTREAEDRRFARIQALNAIAAAVQETNPVKLFQEPGGKGQQSLFDATKLQSINNRWADRVQDLYDKTLFPIMEQIGADVLEPLNAQLPRT